MDPFIKLTGVVAPLDRVNIDTDIIIPAVYLKSIESSGYEDVLFTPWRYNEDGSPNADFVLNQPDYRNANVLVAGHNFGCGSSREHAPWALRDYGIKCIIAPSFADIFYNNCFKNGMLPIVLPEERIQELFQRTRDNPNYQLLVNLETRTISDDFALTLEFDIDPFRRESLLEGLDDIGLTLQHEAKISEFESSKQ